jgi:thiosulfate/3-mercaptopyruvate sulfurtransferase
VFVLHLSAKCQTTPAFKKDNGPLVVGSSWLQNHLGDSSFVILHVGSSIREYKKGHVPGARFLWTQSLAQSSPDLTLELPTSLQADTVFRNLGLNPGVRIVITFAGGNVSPATRVLFTLEQLGLGGKVSLLDGGLDAWKAGGYPTSQETPLFGQGTLKSNLSRSGVVEADWIVRHQHDPAVKVVDARATQFYLGNGGGMPRAGHIPGAVNISFSSVLDSTNKVKDDSTLSAMFHNAGIGKGDTVVTYCHIGQQASVLYLIARKLGYHALLYDGSFEDWSGRDELPVETGGDKR